MYFVGVCVVENEEIWDIPEGQTYQLDSGQLP